MKQRIFIFLLMMTSVALVSPAQNSVGRGGGNNGYGNGNGDCINQPQLPNEDVSEDERQYLLAMREEEKLARDVYSYLASRWELRVFSQIAVSEGKHMEAVKSLLDKYNIPDPVGEDVPGQFSRGDFQELYFRLTSEGSASIGAALKVGATIEELDISDLIKAIAGSDSRDILTVFQNLAKGSRNHLRSFASHLQSLQVVYVPQHISQELYDSIINSEPERGSYDASGTPTGQGNGWDWND